MLVGAAGAACGSRDKTLARSALTEATSALASSAAWRLVAASSAAASMRRASCARNSATSCSSLSHRARRPSSRAPDPVDGSCRSTMLCSSWPTLPPISARSRGTMAIAWEPEEPLSLECELLTTVPPPAPPAATAAAMAAAAAAPLPEPAPCSTACAMRASTPTKLVGGSSSWLVWPRGDATLLAGTYCLRMPKSSCRGGDGRLARGGSGDRLASPDRTPRSPVGDILEGFEPLAGGSMLPVRRAEAHNAFRSGED